MTAPPAFPVRATDPAQAARYRQAGAWTDTLLTDYLDRHACVHPQRTAFIDRRASIDYAQLQSASYRLADALRRRGLQAGAVVAILLPNRIEFALWHLALVRLGAVTCPVTPMSREREVAAILRLAGASWFVTVDEFRGFDHGAMVQRVVAAMPPRDVALNLVIVGEATPGHTVPGLRFEALLAEGRDDGACRAEIDALRPDPDAVAEIVFTSGSSGDPKGVLHTHNTLLAPQLAMASKLGLQPGAVVHMASTVAHQAGFLNGIRLPVQLGGTSVLQEVWSPDEFAMLVERHRVEMSSGSATFLLDLLRSQAVGMHDLSSYRIFRCGGGPIPVALVREAETRLPHLTVVRSWGQTENGVVTMTSPGEPLEQRSDNDGTVQAGMEVRIVDAAGKAVRGGAEGRLQCRGAALCVGYANDPQMFDASFDGDWFDTGDLATWAHADAAAAPAIRITGRAKDLIIRGGENIPVAYVENALFEDTRVLEVAIVAMPDARLGERACAFVICRPGMTYDLDTMRQFLADRSVAAPYWPERVEVVDSLPRTANGKVHKASLRARFISGAGEGASDRRAT